MSATYPIVGDRPYVNMDLNGRQVRFLYDSGNDLTLINHETAAMVGVDMSKAKGGFEVKGISQQPQPFSMVHLPLTIGNHPPITIPVGVGAVKDNLLGRQGVWDRFSTTLDSNQLTFSQKGGDNGLGLSFPIGTNSAYLSHVGFGFSNIL